MLLGSIFEEHFKTLTSQCFTWDEHVSGFGFQFSRVQVSSVVSLGEAFYAMEFGYFHLFNVTFQKNAVCYYFLSGFRCVVLLNRVLEVSTHLCKGDFYSLCSRK